MANEFCLSMPDFHITFKDLLHAVNLRHGTNGFTSPPKEGVLRIFPSWKIRRLRPGFEPANLGTKGQHDTSRPPKPLYAVCTNPTNKKGYYGREISRRAYRSPSDCFAIAAYWRHCCDGTRRPSNGKFAYANECPAREWSYKGLVQQVAIWMQCEGSTRVRG